MIYALPGIIGAIADLVAAIGYPLAALALSTSILRAVERHPLGVCSCRRRSDSAQGAVVANSDHHRHQGH